MRFLQPSEDQRVPRAGYSARRGFAEPLVEAGRYLALEGEDARAASWREGQTSTSSNVPRLSFPLALSLVFVTALGPLAMASLIPAIPSIQSTFGVSRATAQLTLTLSIAAMAACSLVSGTLADRFGRRPALLAGILLAVVGSIVCVIAPSIEWVIAGRCLQAAGATAGVVLTRVVVRDIYPDSRASSLLAYIAAAMMLAPLLGPISSGYLIEYFGWRSVFAPIALLASLSLVLLSSKLPETMPRRPAGDVSRLIPVAEYDRLLRRYTYVRYVVYGAAMQGALTTFVAGAPYVAASHFGLSPAVFGWYFTFPAVGYIVGSLIAGRFVNRWQPDLLLTIGALMALLICGIGVWATSHSAMQAWAFFALAGCFATVVGCVFPSTQVALLTNASAPLGMASGLFSFVQLLLGACLAQVVSMLIGFGPVAVLWVMSGVALTALAATIVPPKPFAAVTDARA